MHHINCMECRNPISSRKAIKRGTILECKKCGSVLKYLDHDEYISRWRIKNKE